MAVLRAFPIDGSCIQARWRARFEATDWQTQRLKLKCEVFVEGCSSIRPPLIRRDPIKNVPAVIMERGRRRSSLSSMPFTTPSFQRIAD